LPEFPVFLSFLLRLGLAITGIFLAYGFSGKRVFFQLVGAFFTASFVFCGVVYGIFAIFHPQKLTIHNGVVYYDLSPLILVITTLIAYGILLLAKNSLKKEKNFCPYAILHLQQNGQTLSVQVKVDTGFTLTDLYGDHPLVLLSPAVAKKLQNKDTKIRLLPFETVNGSGVLPSFLCQRVTAKYEDKTATFSQVVVAVAKENIHNEFQGLIGLDFLERMEWHVTKIKRDHTTVSPTADQKTN
jgi:stage II sporulation protein GA (sporulation sigma-E factor processing peptidase)